MKISKLTGDQLEQVVTISDFNTAIKRTQVFIGQKYGDTASVFFAETYHNQGWKSYNKHARKTLISEYVNFEIDSDTPAAILKNIELFHDLHITDPFDAFEVHPCRNISEDEQETQIEQCEENEAEFWSVHVRFIPTEERVGVECIADCPTKDQATSLKSYLEAMCKMYQPAKTK